ncbi:unnamed protein product [Sympodiomycopsis kandeliae]
MSDAAQYGSRSGTPSTSAQAGPSSSSSIAMARERSPEPDEDLRMEETPTAWLVKVPRFLYEGWSQISEDDLNLGTVRVYDADHKGRQRIELILPSAPDAPIPIPMYDPNVTKEVRRIPRQYDVKLTSEPQETLKRNIFAFKEKQEKREDDEDSDEDEDDSNDDNSDLEASRNNLRRGRKKKMKVSTSFAGKITNEAAVKPILSSASNSSTNVKNENKSILSGGGDRSSSTSSFTPEYREILRRRRLEASKPKRTVKMLDESDTGANNMLAAGLGSGYNSTSGSGNNTFIVSSSSSKGKPGQSSGREKFTRIPRNELLDILFGCYERYTYWTLKALRSETKQPESYLREVLTSIADQHKRGPYVGQWSLKAEFVQSRRIAQELEQQQQQQQQQQQMKQETDGVKTEENEGGGGGGGGEEDDGDDDMEEVI